MASGLMVLGLAATSKKLLRVATRTNDYILVAAKAAGAYVEGVAKAMIATKYYKPAIDTGALRASIKYEVDEYIRFYKVIVSVGFSMYYGVYVHEGTTSQAPRPFMKDALEYSVKEIEQIFIEAVKRVTA